MFIGSLIDRFQPRAIIGLIPRLYWFGLLELWLLFLLTFLAGMLIPATAVGACSLLPDLVKDNDSEAANMPWSFSLNLSLVIGPAVAGVLVASFGGPSVLLMDAGTFAAMAIMAVTLPTLKRSNARTEIPISERLGLRQQEQLGRVFGARSTLLTAGSPLGLAIGGILLAFVPATSVIAFSALACLLVGLVGLMSPAFRDMSLPAAGLDVVETQNSL